MKFGKQLKLESVPAWQEHYVSYKRLKRIIKKLVLQSKVPKSSESTRSRTPSPPPVNPSSPSPSSSPSHSSSDAPPAASSSVSNDPLLDARKEFFAVFENDIDKINRFYKEKVEEFQRTAQLLIEESKKIPEIQQNQTDQETEPLIQAHSVTEAIVLSVSSSSISPVPLSPSSSKSVTARCSKSLELYRHLHEIHSFSLLNYEGLRKIMKKFDKNMGESHQEKSVERLKTEAFYDCERVNKLMKEVEGLYTKLDVARGGDALTAHVALRTVVKDLRTPKEDDLHEGKYVYLWLFFSVFLAALFYFLPILDESSIRAHKCLSLMAFVTVLWVTEAVPFFVASLSIPLLVITSGILADPITGVEYSAERAARIAFAAMFNDTIMLILGGFSISAAFSKCQFELQLASFIQRMFGHRPRLFLLAFMFLGAFLSMWISNVAAPVLLTSLLLPIVRDFGSTNEYARALLIGLAFSCNIGGMMSPISSPQNAIALGYLEATEPDFMISFGEWILLSIPFCSIGVLISWAYLIFVFLRNEKTIPEIPVIVFEKAKMTRVHMITLATSVATILLWCSLSYTRPVLGEMGTVAVLPVVLLFGTGVLDKNDLFNFSWHLILLIGGGSVLGAAVNSSHLLQILTDACSPYLLGKSLWVTTAAVLTLVFFITTFVSHTVAALILTPVIVSLGIQTGHVQIVLFTATLMMSGTQSLPLSSFPNVNSLLIDDDFNRPFLHASDYLKHGTAVSLALFILLGSFGYLECLLVFGS
jgi:phosphate transporter